MNRNGFSWNRMLGVGFAALLVLAFFGGTAISQEKAYPVVRAQKFELVDAKGNSRALLSTFADGSTMLLLYDSAGKARVKVAVEQDGSPRIALADASGKAIGELPAKLLLQRTAKPTVELAVSDVKMGFNEYRSRVIAGVAQNSSQQRLSSAYVTFNLYDAQGRQVGSAIDSTNNLEPGGVWRFEATVSESAAVTFKQTEAYGYPQ